MSIREVDLPDSGTVQKVRGLNSAGASINIASGPLADLLGTQMHVTRADGSTQLLPAYLADISVAAATGILGYGTKALMVAAAPTTPPTGTLRNVENDPSDVGGSVNGTWRFDPAVGGDHWVKSADTTSALTAAVAALQGPVSNSSADLDSLFSTTSLARPIAFADTSQYTQCWLTISNPSTRFAITPSDSGYTVTGLAALPGVWDVGLKLPWDLIPGDSYYIEGVYSAGTLDANAGFWFGTDTAPTGDISAAARMTVFRNGTLLPCTQNGQTGDGSRLLTPPWLGGIAGPPGLGIVHSFAIDVLADRSTRWRVFENGVQQVVDVVSPATPIGRIILGLNIANGWVGTITKVLRRSSSGTHLYVDSTWASAGTGTRANPLKALTDIPAVLASRGFVDEVTIHCLSDTVHGFLQLKDTVARKWTINGRPGGRTVIDGANQGEVITWTVVAGTGGKVFSTPTKWGPDLRSHPNQVFIPGRPQSGTSPHIVLPDTIVKFVVTANGGVDMAGLTAGAWASSNSICYCRLPDGMTSDPTGQIILSRAAWLIEVLGAPEVYLNNVILRHASGHCFVGGSGSGRIAGCGAEYSGWGGNGWDEYNGSYFFDNCYARYVWNDCFGRAPRTDMGFQPAATFTTRLKDCEMSHTIEGDGVSQHLLAFPTAALSNTNRLFMNNCYVHDCTKCGVVTTCELVMITGGKISRCGAEQLSLFANPAQPVGRDMLMIVSGVVIDPDGIGTAAVRSISNAGIGSHVTELNGCWIGQPAAGGGSNCELRVSMQAVAGEVADPTAHIIRCRNTTTRRASGSVVKIGGGTEGTFDIVPSNALV